MVLGTQIISITYGRSKHSFEATHFRPSKVEQDSQSDSGLPNGSKPKRIKFEFFLEKFKHFTNLFLNIFSHYKSNDQYTTYRVHL